MKSYLKSFIPHINKGIFFAVGLGQQKILVSTQERNVGETNNKKKIHGVVEKFENLDSLNRVSGFGAAQDLSIVINDLTGFFYDMFFSDTHYTEKIRNDVYIGYNGCGRLFKIAELEINDVRYEDNKLYLSMSSPDRNVSIGTTPDSNDLYLYEDHMGIEEVPNELLRKLYKGGDLPNVYGAVEYMPVEQMYEDLILQVKEEFLTPGVRDTFNIRLFNKYQLFIPEFFFSDSTLQTVYMIGEDQGTYGLVVKGNIYEATDPITDDPEYLWTFEREDVSENFFPVIAGSYVSDFIEAPTFSYSPLLTYGRQQLVLDFIEVEGSRIQAPGSKQFIPWLKGMFVKQSYAHHERAWDSFLQLHKPTGYTYFQYYNWAYVAEQRGRVITLAVSAGGADSNYGGTFSEVKLAMGRCATIREGTEIFVPRILERLGIYIVDMKEDTVVTKVCIDDSDTKYQLEGGITHHEWYEIPEGNYTVYHTDGTDDNRLFNGPPIPCTYIRINPHVISRFKMDRGSEDSGRMHTYDIYVSAKNHYKNLGDIIGNLTEQYGGFKTIGGKVFDGVRLNFSLIDGEPLYDIISEVCWQMRSAVRETIVNDDFAAEIIPLEDETVVHTFDSRNILEHSLTLSYSPKDDICTIFRVTKSYPDYPREEEEEIFKNNDDVYKTEEYPVTFFLWPDGDDKHYQKTMDFWIERLSNSWLEITLTTTIETLHLEIWDYVAVNLPEGQYYEGKSEQTLLERFGRDQRKFRGRIRDISTDFSAGTITYTIRTEVKMSVE